MPFDVSSNDDAVFVDIDEHDIKWADNTVLYASRGGT
jgi:hypothetical protein